MELSEEEKDWWKHAFENPEVLYLSQVEWDALQEHLARPAEPNEALRKLFHPDEN